MEWCGGGWRGGGSARFSIRNAQHGAATVTVKGDRPTRHHPMGAGVRRSSGPALVSAGTKLWRLGQNLAARFRREGFTSKHMEERLHTHAPSFRRPPSYEQGLMDAVKEGGSDLRRNDSDSSVQLRDPLRRNDSDGSVQSREDEQPIAGGRRNSRPSRECGLKLNRPPPSPLPAD